MTVLDYLRGRVRRCGLFLLGAFWLSAPIASATAQTNGDDDKHRPMRIAIVREAEAACEPMCPEWIYAYGSIEPSTPAQLEKVFKQLGARRLPIIIESAGGDTDAALKMGRMIRKRGLDIAVGHTRFKKCSPEKGGCKPLWSLNTAYAGSAYPGRANCDSACAYLFAGGVTRLMGATNYMGVHQGIGVTYIPASKRGGGVTKKSTDQAVTNDLLAQYRPKVESYYSEMGVNIAIVPTIFSSVDMVDLSQEQVRYYGVVTAPGDATDLIAVRICKKSPRPDNCILHEAK